MPPSVLSRSARGDDGFRFTVDVDMGDMPTLPDRLADTFQQALIFHLEDAAMRVINTARGYLTRLEEPANKWNAEGKAIHGYDTGVMYVSLKYELMTALLVSGVYYELLSDDAKYWRYVEFGFHKANGEWWPGYHFLETAIEENAGYIRQRCREAWHDTAIRLALEAQRPGGAGRLGIPHLPAGGIL